MSAIAELRGTPPGGQTSVSAATRTEPRPPSAGAATIVVRQIFISPGHNFFGRYGQPAGDHAIVAVGAVECVAGRGLRGDRFFGYKPDYKGQVTLFARETLVELRREFGRAELSAAGLRRNVITEGADLNALIGQEFQLQGVWLEGVEECRPCFWMNEAIAPGAEAWLRGRGGLRCRVRSDGWLRVD